MGNLAPLEMFPGAPPSPGSIIFQTEIRSSLEDGRRAVEAGLDVLKQRGYVQGSTDEMRAWLCLTEVVVNAIVHGSELDPEKIVGFILFETEDSWGAQIEDQGRGFEEDQLPDPIKCLEEDHGRGIFLMRSFMDRVAYYFGGRVAQLEKRRAVRHPVTAERRDAEE